MVQDNPHQLAAEDSQQGGLQLMKKPGQLLTRDQLKAQKVIRHKCHVHVPSCARKWQQHLRQVNFVGAERKASPLAASLESPMHRMQTYQAGRGPLMCNVLAGS